jgi:hypothetical protein
MAIDSANVQITKANYELLCDVETLLGLACVIIEVVQRLSKFAQGRGTFIYDFVDALKLVEVDLFIMYYENLPKFSHQQFSNTKIEYVAFYFNGKFYMLHIINQIMKVMNMVTKNMRATCVEDVQQQCSEVAIDLICELERQFLAQEFLNVIKVIYPQYWMAPKEKISFPSHFVILQVHLGHPKAWGAFGAFGGPIFNPILLDEQFVKFSN